MFNYKCEECLKGIVRDVKKKNHKVTVDGIEFNVPTAIIGVCDHCGAVNYAGEEMHRWHELFKAWQVKSGKYISPLQIKQIREHLSLNQSQFADFLGISRQALSAWENEKRAQVQPNNVDIILRILYDDIGKVSRPVTQKMMTQYYQRIGKIIHYPEQVITENKGEILRKILPKNIYKIINEKALINNSSVLTEICLLTQTRKYTEQHAIYVWSDAFKSEVLTQMAGMTTKEPFQIYKPKEKGKEIYAGFKVK